MSVYGYTETHVNYAYSHNLDINPYHNIHTSYCLNSPSHIPNMLAFSSSYLKTHSSVFSPLLTSITLSLILYDSYLFFSALFLSASFLFLLNLVLYIILLFNLNSLNLIFLINNLINLLIKSIIFRSKNLFFNQFLFDLIPKKMFLVKIITDKLKKRISKY